MEITDSVYYYLIAYILYHYITVYSSFQSFLMKTTENLRKYDNFNKILHIRAGCGIITATADDYAKKT